MGAGGGADAGGGIGGGADVDVGAELGPDSVTGCGHPVIQIENKPQALQCSMYLFIHRLMMFTIISSATV